jgi:hypothetical protein
MPKGGNNKLHEGGGAAKPITTVAHPTKIRDTARPAPNGGR